MTSHPPKMNRATAEQLLTGQRGRTGVHRVLAAASAPGTARELASESTAVAQFRTANLHPVNPVRRRSVLKTAAAKLLAAKVVVGAAVAAAATGGIAVAAAANLGSGPANHGTRPAVAASGTHPTGRPSTQPGRPSPLPTPTSAGRPSSAHPSSSASRAAEGSPSPSLVGLCTAYQAGVATNPGRALDNPAFTALIIAAGGKDNVIAYCAAILPGPHPSGTPSHPTAAPSSPSSHPAEPPSTHPDAPTHPTGPPSTPPEHQ
jgi:hypothetical protein